MPLGLNLGAGRRQAGQQNQPQQAAQDLFRQEEIRLISRDGGEDQHGVRFFVTPDLNETRTVNYQEISEIRSPGALLIYIGSSARTYQITAKMVSRTQEEAERTYRYTHILKSWTVPAKTSGGGIDKQNAPEVLKLYGYGQNAQIRGVPVVMTSLSIDYPSNVSYIQAVAEGGTAFIPIIQTFSISLKEARNMEDLNANGATNFDLIKYKRGLLPNW
jgi:hypothetical protein